MFKEGGFLDNHGHHRERSTYGFYLEQTLLFFIHFNRRLILASGSPATYVIERVKSGVAHPPPPPGGGTKQKYNDNGRIRAAVNFYRCNLPELKRFRGAPFGGRCTPSGSFRLTRNPCSHCVRNVLLRSQANPLPELQWGSPHVKSACRCNFSEQ